MKRTNEQEAEVLNAYHAYWNSYLSGDMETYASLLAENCHIIGSTAFDVFDSKQAAVDFYTATAGQISGKAEFRDRKIKLLSYLDSVMVQELCDFYFLGDEEWSFYGHGRLSTLLSETETGWKIIHQHGSFPDSKAEEGKQIATEKITQENRELHEAVKRRTVELHHKNRELEIESSLERVRTVAMAMNEPADMLAVCKTIASQLHLLGVNDIRNVQTAIFYEAKGTYMNYEYYARHDKPIITEAHYTTEKTLKAFARKMLKGKDEVYTTNLTGKALTDWLAYQKTTNVFVDPFLAQTTSLHYYWYSLGPIAMGMSSYAPLHNEDLASFKRFHTVFDLAYRRYLDIEKAQAQAREAQVELSLEKVRSRSMAMHRSHELAEAASVLFQQIKELGYAMWSCGFCIWKENDFSELWMSADSGGLLPPMLMPYKDEPTHRKIYEASLRQEAVHEYVWEGDELATHYAFLHTIPSVKEALDILKKSGLSLPGRQCYYVGFFKQGYLLMITKEPVPEMHDLTYRFTRVFEQTYTRFLDLQKAEQLTEQTKLDLIQIQTEKKRAENALAELKATQAQLIQKEKLASLGELTAGIAHEIQNPLNFVNNFADVSAELVQELEAEQQKITRDASLEREILGDVKQNLQKVVHHGRRASAIVRAMLEHSRNSSGQREPTNLNNLAEEYLRLAYQALRAKDKTFNCALKTDFDPDLDQVTVVAQDIGRVLLNLFNNAFYAVQAKQKQQTDDYVPTVTLQTAQTAGGVCVRVQDNGTGMPESIKARIFQPFFTTKPTGEGTGLGLSLSYDIVTKGHGGTLWVESTAGEGSVFVITLPQTAQS